MKTMPASIFLWVFIALMCVYVISVPISAAGRNADTLDAVAGSRSGVYQLLGTKSGSTYDICASSAKGGTFSASTSSSLPGKTVEVYIQPDTGYQMASIYVISATGDSAEVTLENGIYSFVMPDEPVVIDVTFQFKRIA